MYLGGPVAPNCTINKIKSSPGPTARTRILLHPSTQIAESSTIYVHPQTSQSSPCTPKSPTHPQTPLRQKSLFQARLHQAPEHHRHKAGRAAPAELRRQKIPSPKTSSSPHIRKSHKQKWQGPTSPCHTDYPKKSHLNNRSIIRQLGKLSPYCPHCIHNLTHPLFRRLLCTADILSEQTLRNAKSTRNGRSIQLRMLHKQPVQHRITLLLKKAIETKILIKLRPRYTESISSKTLSLLLRSLPQTRIIRETLTSLPTVNCTYPDSRIRHPNLFNLYHITYAY